MSPKPIRRFSPILALVAGLVVWTACAAFLHRGHVGDTLDDGMFLVSAQALSRGQGFILPSRPGEPPQTRYPVGFPALVAAVLRLAPGQPSLARDAAMARGAVLASGWVFLGASYLWLRRWRVGPWPAVFIVLATAFNPFVIWSAIVVMSDLPFHAVAAILMALWATRGEAPGRSVVDGMLAGAGMLLRGNGITLALGAFVAAARRRPRVLAFGASLLGLALLLVPASAYKSRYRTDEPSDYAISLKVGYSSPAAAAGALGRNLGMMASDLPLSVLPAPAFLAPVGRVFEASPWMGWVLRGSIGVLIAAGLVRAVGRRLPGRWPIAAHAGATLALFLVWPWPFSDRYVFGLFPMALWLLGDGVSTVARRLGVRPRLARRLGAATLLLAFLGSAGVTARLAWTCANRGGLWSDAAQSESLEATLQYLRSRTESRAVVAAMLPEMVYLYAGRQALPLVEVEDWMRDQPSPSHRLATRIAALGDRPIYLLLASSADSLDGRQAAILKHDNRFEIRPLFRSHQGAHVVARIRRSFPRP